MVDFVDMILEWLKAHVGVIFMGVAGATVTALVPSGKPLAERVISWLVGVILYAALSTLMILYYSSRQFDKLTFCDKMNSF